MYALVTGGSGFIGSALVKRLQSEGHKVTNMDIRGRAAGASFFKLCDIREHHTVEVIRDLEPDVIFHLAAQTSVQKSLHDPAGDAETNVQGSVNVLEGARMAGSRVIYAASGGTLYGFDSEYSSETRSHRPTSPYGVSKKVVLDYLDAYRWRGVESISLALANVYGPGATQGVIPHFIEALVNDYPVEVTDSSRDYVYIDDVVDAFMRAAASNDKDAGLFNIGSGISTNTMRLLKMLADSLGKDQVPSRRPLAPGEVRRNSLAWEKARWKLDWFPRVSLKEGLSRMIDRMIESKGIVHD